MVDQSYFFSIPRELRDEIYDYLIDFHEVTYPAVRKLNDRQNDSRLYPRMRTVLAGQDYIDSRVTLPIKPDLKPGQICRRMRQEYLEHFNFHMKKSGEEIKIGMNVLVQTRTNHGSYIPVRDKLSPTFINLLPYMALAKDVRFEVVPGYSWWNGEQCDAMASSLQMALAGLTSAEKVDIDITMHVWDFWNLNLPDKRHQRVSSFIETPMRKADGRPYMYAKRRMLLVGQPEQEEDFHFYCKVEVFDQTEDKVLVVEESGTIGDDEDLEAMEFKSSTFHQEAIVPNEPLKSIFSQDTMGKGHLYLPFTGF